MMDKETLDILIPVPDQDELKDEIKERLTEKGFSITNYRTVGIFNIILMIFIKVYIELLNLARTIVSNSTINNAVEAWLEVKAKDFGKERKQADYTKGEITLKRDEANQNITIQKGNIFKTEQDKTGKEYRFIVEETTIFQKDKLICKIPVKAEYPGSEYNLSPNLITKSLTHIETVNIITNDENWITQEGADIEAVESFRSRTLNVWSELSTSVIADKYKNVAEGVTGVLYAQINDQHPRGQGTVDIIITSTAGQATENLISQVTLAVEKIRGPYDNLLVKSSEVVYQDISVILEVNSYADIEGLEEKANKVIKELLEVNSDRELNKLYIADIIYSLKNKLTLKNVKVSLPAEDVEEAIDKVILLGNLQVTVKRV